MIFVIDGVSGSGKSSTAKRVADKLGIQYLDSGALYRAATSVWLDEGRPTEGFIDILSSKDISFEYMDGEFAIYINGTDISGKIREQRISEAVSTVAAMPEVRAFVNALMRKAVKSNRYIADGRDLGTAVFPDADLKFFMTASINVRARRRYRELQEKGEQVSLDEVKKNLIQRDVMDTSRDADPLLQHEDAYELDTSERTFDEQVDEISNIIRKYLQADKS